MPRGHRTLLRQGRTLVRIPAISQQRCHKDHNLGIVRVLAGGKTVIGVPFVCPAVPVLILVRPGIVLSFGMPRASPTAAPSMHPFILSSIDTILKDTDR